VNRRTFTVVLTTCASLLAMAGTLAVLAFEPSRENEATLYFARLTAVFAGLALLAGVVAAVVAVRAWRISRHQYDAWLAKTTRSPDVRIWFAAEGENQGTPRPLEDGQIDVAATSFVLRVVVENNGNGTLNGILNIMVLAECEITPLDEPPKFHYRSLFAAGNSEIVSGREQAQVNFTVAERDFVPGHHLYHVLVTTPRPGQWPIMAALDGDPPPSVRAHGMVVTHTRRRTRGVRTRKPTR